MISFSQAFPCFIIFNPFFTISTIHANKAGHQYGLARFITNWNMISSPICTYAAWNTNKIVAFTFWALFAVFHLKPPMYYSISYSIPHFIKGAYIYLLFLLIVFFPCIGDIFELIKLARIIESAPNFPLMLSTALSSLANFSSF